MTLSSVSAVPRLQLEVAIETKVPNACSVATIGWVDAVWNMGQGANTRSLHHCQVLEQAAEGQRRGAEPGLQPGDGQVVGLPAEGRAQPVERARQLLDLGAGQGRFPWVLGHGATLAGGGDTAGPAAASPFKLRALP